MAYTKYESRKFSGSTQRVIDQANAICEEYAEANIPLTLRQLYYQFVSRGLLPENTQKQYKRIGDICRNARMAGEMDWDHLIDMTRDLRRVGSWKGPEDLLKESADSYHRDLWKPQRKRVEVWIEKDAAIGVVQGVCKDNSVPLFSCRGFTSLSEMHDAAQRIRYWVERGDQFQILHIGDHDPSGLDMTRDIKDRLRKFIQQDWYGLHRDQFPFGAAGLTSLTFEDAMRGHMREQGTEIEDHVKPWSLKRIALNWDQIEEYSPPPNYAKESDSRYESYVENTGQTDSWELDALDPTVLAGLIQENIDALRDERLWAETEREMEEERTVLTAIGNNYERVKSFLDSNPAPEPEEGDAA